MGLPDCELVRILRDKGKERGNDSDKYIRILEQFSDGVSQELSLINLLFTEFTPHDEKNHIANLFRIADRILETKRYELMNFAELLVLAVSLYGHDWGMAVSNVERNYITLGELADGYEISDISLLPDERTQTKTFARRYGLKIDDEGRLGDIPIEIWREYVRETHADRSAFKISRFFLDEDTAFGIVASKIARSHYYDCGELHNHINFPTDYSVLSENVNLRALAVYLRLIDLFDIANDRTPYLIWKFVAPRDPKSKLEWEKHKALQPITCPEYMKGRVIKVDGSTDDHDVYAALEDLRLYCDKQFNECKDILALMRDNRHSLDIFHVEWKVEAIGFRPLSIQFEFDRNRMFEILGDEIYQGDTYVFLRELLQNSIDAIRTRIEVLKKKGLSPIQNYIEVLVEHTDDGNSVVTWTDQGIGMDEYVIKNYLAVAGRSYYRSEDFEKLGITIDPISRFGIGLLSCFMVANKIEIVTKHQDSDKTLHITIPSASKHFRIEEKKDEDAKVGTKVIVHIEGSKVVKTDKHYRDKHLKITEYLKIIAGFVEFPILVKEDGCKTVIAHPKLNLEKIKEDFGQDIEVHQLKLEYPLEEIVLPQDLSIAEKCLKIQTWDINKDLCIEEYEGVINYPIPLNEHYEFSSWTQYSGREPNVELIDLQNESNRAFFRWLRTWDDSSNFDRALSRSANYSSMLKVYHNGIFVSGAEEAGFERALLPSPQVILNITNSSLDTIDISRTEIKDNDSSWHEKLLIAHLKRIKLACLNDYLSIEPRNLIVKIIRAAVYHNISISNLLELIETEKWPLPFLSSKGTIKVLQKEKIGNGLIYTIPEMLIYYLEELELYNWLVHEERRTEIFNSWKGDDCLIYSSSQPKFRHLIELLNFSKELIKYHYALKTIRFLKGPSSSIPIMPQEVYIGVQKSDEKLNRTELLEKAKENPLLLKDAELESLNFLLRSRQVPIPTITHFEKPYEDYHAYGLRYININNVITQEVIKCYSSICLLPKEYRRTIEYGKLMDCVRKIFGSSYLRVSFHPDKYLGYIKDLLKQSEICNIYHSAISESLPNTKLYVESSYLTLDDNTILVLESHEISQFNSDEPICEFGDVIS